VLVLPLLSHDSRFAFARVYREGKFSGAHDRNEPRLRVEVLVPAAHAVMGDGRWETLDMRRPHTIRPSLCAHTDGGRRGVGGYFGRSTTSTQKRWLACMASAMLFMSRDFWVATNWLARLAV
jgi:hypothetical protein